MLADTGLYQQDKLQQKPLARNYAGTIFLPAAVVRATTQFFPYFTSYHHANLFQHHSWYHYAQGRVGRLRVVIACSERWSRGLLRVMLVCKVLL